MYILKLLFVVFESDKERRGKINNDSFPTNGHIL